MWKSPARFLLLPFAVFVLGFGLAACDGDDDDDDGNGDDTPTATQDDTETTTSTTEPGDTETPSPDPTVDDTPTPPADGVIDPTGADVTPATTTPSPAAPSTQPTLVDVRSAEHDEQGGWDRIVFEWEGGLPGASVSYVDSASQCGSGAAVDVEGDAILEIRFENAAAHNEQGEATFGEQELDGPGDAIEEAIQTCDFEGVVTWVLGIDDEDSRYVVTTLTGPDRLVIDVEH